jgi:hypothetical protein
MSKGSLMQGTAAAASAAVLILSGWAGSAAAQQAGSAPLARDGEFIEVTDQNTLRHRYHSKDFAKDMAFYLEQAKEHAKGRTPGKMKIQQVLIREIDIMGPGGKQVGTCKIPENFITESAEYEKTFADLIFAMSDGSVTVEWLPTQIIDKAPYDNQGDLGGNWWLDPKRLEGQLDFLKDIKEGDMDFMFFYLHAASRADNTNSLVWPEFGGMAWGGVEIKGARLLTLNDHELARSVHELGHHIFDTTIQETEGMTVTRPHGLIDAGYAWNALDWGGGTVGTLNLGPCMAYYRDCYRFYNPRDMWERWRLRPAHNIAHEPFSGKAYAWADVKHDYWFKLPQLHTAELQALTGLQNVQTFAPDAALVFASGQADDPFYGGATPLVTGVANADNRLNATLSLSNESCAYLKTSTGQWLFVKPQVADFFVDLLKLRNGKGDPLPVYGYVLEGFKAAVAMRLPDDFPGAPDEIGLFRPLPITATAEGLVAPDDYRFTKTASVKLATSLKGATLRYTLDESEPTEASPAADGPIALSDTTTIKARLFGADVPQGQATWRKTYEYRPFSAKVEGLTGGAGTWFTKKATIRFKMEPGAGTVRYTVNGQAPDASSPAFAEPIVAKETTTLMARYFDADNKPHGYIWAARFDENNLAMGKPVTSSAGVNPNEKPEFAVDGYVDGAKYWGTIPAPQWLQVDLEKDYTIDRIHMFPYWDGSRYYQYAIDASTDGKTWTRVVDASANTEVETDRGRLHTFAPAKARYVKLTMLKNSDNPAIHVVEMQVFEARD